MFVSQEGPPRPSDHVVNRDEYGIRSTSNDGWGVGLPYDIPTVFCLRAISKARCVIGASVGLCSHRIDRHMKQMATIPKISVRYDHPPERSNFEKKIRHVPSRQGKCGTERDRRRKKRCRRCSFARFALISLPFWSDRQREGREGIGRRTDVTKRRRIDARLVSTHHNISIPPSHHLFFVLGRDR